MRTRCVAVSNLQVGTPEVREEGAAASCHGDITLHTTASEAFTCHQHRNYSTFYGTVFSLFFLLQDCA